MYSLKIILACLFICYSLTSCNPGVSSSVKTGDIIFQETMSLQCQAVKLATKSRYSHIGIIINKNDSDYVFEAVQPVKFTPLKKWIERGNDSRYVIKRLINHDEIFTNIKISELKKNCDKYLGKNYDKYFEWSDERIYCSELVWKLYKETFNIELGKLQEFREFDLSSKIVSDIIEERFGDNIPYDEPVIAPVQVFNYDNLITIREN